MYNIRLTDFPDKCTVAVLFIRPSIQVSGKLQNKRCTNLHFLVRKIFIWILLMTRAIRVMYGWENFNASSQVRLYMTKKIPETYS